MKEAAFVVRRAHRGDGHARAAEPRGERVVSGLHLAEEGRPRLARLGRRGGGRVLEDGDQAREPARPGAFGDALGGRGDDAEARADVLHAPVRFGLAAVAPAHGIDALEEGAELFGEEASLDVEGGIHGKMGRDPTREAAVA